MSPKKLRDHLVDFYADESLPENTHAWLGSLAKADAMGEASARGSSPKKRLAKAGYALAGLIAILLCANIALLVSDRSIEQQPSRTVTLPTAASPTTDTVPAGRQPLPDEPTPTPNLLAVKVHADWCPRSPDVGRIFNKLAEKHGDQPVLFVTLDVTRETTRRQARLMTSTLGIDWVTKTAFQTGMVKLIDRKQHEVLATLTDEKHLAKWENALTLALPQTPPQDSEPDGQP